MQILPQYRRDILSVRLRNRATALRMLASSEWEISRTELREELRAIAAELERDAETAMSAEVRACA